MDEVKTMLSAEHLYDVFALLSSETLARVRDWRIISNLLPGYELLHKQTWVNNSGKTAEECKQAVLTSIQERIDDLTAFKNSVLALDVDDSLKAWFYQTDDGKKLLQGWRAILNADVETMLQLTDHAKLWISPNDPAGGIIWSLLNTAGVPVRRGGWQGGSWFFSQVFIIVNDQALLLQHKHEQGDVRNEFATAVVRVEQTADGQYQFKDPNKDRDAIDDLAKRIATKMREKYKNV
jgi:hypothetical protein